MNPNSVIVGRTLFAYRVRCVVVAALSDRVELKALQTRNGIRKGDIFTVSYEALMAGELSR